MASMSSKKRTPVRFLVISLVVGLLLTVVLGFLITSSKHYVDLEHADQIICASVDSLSTTSTKHGFPLPLVTTFDNGCIDIAPEWHVLNLITNIAFFSALTLVVLYLRRKIK